MIGHTHTIAEWVAMVDIAASGYAAFSCFYFLLVDADRADFDPRPTVRRALESGRFDPVLCAVGPVKYDARHTAERLLLAAANTRDRARLAVIDALLRLTAPKGTTR